MAKPSWGRTVRVIWRCSSWGDWRGLAATAIVFQSYVALLSGRWRGFLSGHAAADARFELDVTRGRALHLDAALVVLGAACGGALLGVVGLDTAGHDQRTRDRNGCGPKTARLAVCTMIALTHLTFLHLKVVRQLTIIGVV